MSERFLARSAVMLFLFRVENGVQELLLQRRQNTGYADGMWDCAATGHVDENESMKTAMMREAKEELGIDIAFEDIEFATLMHKYTPSTGNTYYNAFFTVREFTGAPSVQEPEKCAQLHWFPVNDLPTDFLPDRKQALLNHFSNIPYDETGWAYSRPPEYTSFFQITGCIEKNDQTKQR